MPIIQPSAKEPHNHNYKNHLSQKEQGGKSDFCLIQPKYDLSDVICNEKTSNEIKSLISLKKNFSHVFEIMGFYETHKESNKFIINFYGSPGTGKTITAHAIAKELERPLLIVDYSEIESKYVGETPKNLKRVFDFAKEEKCLIFFDEADAILSKRVSNMQSATDTSVNQTRSVLLNILNDFDGDLIFATNFISNYDSAFMRRISKHIFFDLPDNETRKKLFHKYTPARHFPHIDIAQLASVSEGMSAADIEKAMLMAAFHASYQHRNNLIQQDILNQIISIQKSRQDNINEKEITKTRIIPQLPPEIQQQLKTV